MRNSHATTLLCSFRVAVAATALSISGIGHAAGSKLNDQPTPYLADDALVKRAAPLLEIGDPFLQTGNLAPGFELPGGAIWQPRLWVYGTARSAVQTWRDPNDVDRSEWVNRLDLFANLQLSGTERVLLGVQPLHRDQEFTGQSLEPSDSMDAYNSRIRTLFFEGDFGELFPWLDPDDRTSNDIGISIGRQPLFFQDGMLINDQVDAIGFSRNSLRLRQFSWLSNLRISAVLAWNQVHGADNLDTGDRKLAGLFAQWDTEVSTVNTDLAFVRGDTELDDDLWVAGVDAIQRLGLVNTTFRINASFAPNQRSTQADNGVLLFTEWSWSPAYTDNNAYINAFVGIDQYRSAARDPLAGGPLGRTGILFGARGLGAYPAALSNSADDAYGIAAGYQMFFAGIRRQLIVEAGGRDQDSNTSAGLAVRFQQALGRRFVFLLEGFAATHSELNDSYGLSTELMVKF